MKCFNSFRDKTTTPGAPSEPLCNFSPRAQQVLAIARKEAERFNHNFTGTEHLLLGLIKLGQGVAVDVLRKLGLDLELMRSEIEKQVGTGPDRKMFGFTPYTPRVKKVLNLAQKEARELGHKYVGTEHILLGLLREGDGVAARVLNHFEVDMEQTRQEILRELDPTFRSGEETAGTSEVPPCDAVQTNPPDPIDTTRRYDLYCSERPDGLVVYRNVLFKAWRSLLPLGQQDAFAEFLEIEQAEGKTIFIPRTRIVRFCEHGVTPDAGGAAGTKP